DNSQGQLGGGVTGGSTPTHSPVLGLDRVLSVACGYFTSVALKADGTVWTWGWNGDGELGNPSLPANPPVAVPQQVSALTGVMAISSSDSVVAAVKSTGTIKSFGSNANGELGNGQTSTQLPSSAIPVQTIPAGSTVLPPFKAVSASSSMHRLALASDGTVWAWGSNQYGALGNSGPDSPNPIKVEGISDVIG